MPYEINQVNLGSSAGLFRRALHFAFYDWTREMPKSKRVITWIGILIQGYAIYAGMSRSLAWPLMWPKGIPLYASVYLLYLLGSGIVNGMLAAEFVRKTQLESDQIAARQIQQTLHPQNLEEVKGYHLETFYRPFRDVGGDYFDVIELSGNRTLLAVADVSGKGMPAALLAANIQALVRSMASIDIEDLPLALAVRINRHLYRYTPSDRFATAVFVVLSRDSGEMTYVNAGHNAPMVCCPGLASLLQATGMPLGLFAEAQYETRTTAVPPGGTLLLFTDGLTDSISGDDPGAHLRHTLAGNPARTMLDLRALIDPRLNKDDVTILLVRREPVLPLTSFSRETP